MEDDWDEIHPAILRLKTVCRCNNIKYKTIEAAIKAGATSVEAIAKKTTATTGQCGGTCRPKIELMLEQLLPKG